GPVRLPDGLDELLARGGLPVVPGDVGAQAASEALLPEERVEHPDDLGALLVHGPGVEVADLAVLVRAYGVGLGPGVLGELALPQRAHVSNALHAGAAPVAGEALVAVDGQALLQGELEHVAAGDAVAGPVVEVLVGDDG